MLGMSSPNGIGLFHHGLFSRAGCGDRVLHRFVGAVRLTWLSAQPA